MRIQIVEDCGNDDRKRKVRLAIISVDRQMLAPHDVIIRLLAEPAKPMNGDH